MFFLRYFDINVRIVMFHRARTFGIYMEEEHLEAQKLSVSLYVFDECCKNQCFRIMCVYDPRKNDMPLLITYFRDLSKEKEHVSCLFFLA